ncbi:integrase core domain-containing protein [Nonomuraea sp. M3C6]|uniref:Integrase core domain-containing protein n=1 Tax=Nonomuraea marmarensis TaxID=3351344 RepID=A0ABW7ATP2_9ACTN
MPREQGYRQGADRIDRDAVRPASSGIRCDTPPSPRPLPRRVPRMNAVMERWVRSCRRELLDRCLLRNERHLRHALREYEHFYNQHRTHQALDQAAPLRAVSDPIIDPVIIVDLNVRRRDRLGGALHAYHHAA